MNITENIQKLIDLAKEHPDLPIVAMVDGEVVGCDDYGRWVAGFGSVELGEYALFDDRFLEDREDFKERYYDYYDDELCNRFGYEPGINEFTLRNGHCTQEQLMKNKENEKRLDEYLDKVAERAFKRAIIVNIDLPDDVEQFEGVTWRNTQSR